MRGVVKRGAYFSALFVYLFSTFLAVILVLIPPKAMAAGDIYFEYEEGTYRGTRVTDTRINISASFIIKEDTLGPGGTGVGSQKIEMALEKDPSRDTQEQEAWLVKDVTPNVIEVGLSDGTTKKWDYSVSHNSLGWFCTSLIDSVYAERKNTALCNLYIDYGAAAQRVVSPRENTAPDLAFVTTPIDNTIYNNKRIGGHVIGNYSTPGDSTTDSTTLKSWFDREFNDLKIDFHNDQKGSPPTIKLGQKSDVPDRPEIEFKLKHFHGEGSGLPVGFIGLIGAVIQVVSSVRNQEWYSFEATIKSTNTPIPNFYLLVNEVGNAFFYYDADNDPEGTTKGKVNETIGDPEINSTDLGILIAYVMNDPSDGSNNCLSNKSDGTMRVTGPTGSKQIGSESPDQESLFDLPRYKDKPSEVAALNQNCSNVSDNGWLEYWGISDKTSANPLSVEGCGIGSIINFSKGIGEIFRVLLDCMIKEIFTPAVTWAADLIKYAAGLSYDNRHRHYIRELYLG